jgi:hypothetical protein
MEINEVGNPNADGANLGVNAEKIEGTAASSGINTAQGYSLDTNPKTEKTEESPVPKQASGSGIFGGFKIGAGKSSASMKNTLSGGSNVQGGSLMDRV